jgi:hypothetical protein
MKSQFDRIRDQEPSEYRTIVEESYRNITRGQNIAKDKEYLIEIGHRSGITGFVWANLIWHYTVIKNKPRLLWYIDEIKRFPDSIGRQSTYCWMMRREKKNIFGLIQEKAAKLWLIGRDWAWTRNTIQLL